MNHKKVITLFLITIVAGILTACNHTGNTFKPVAENDNTDLNGIITELPDAPGYETFKRNCMSCHSARYIQMQPDLSEKTWTGIVNKMKKNFGAPVADSSAQMIIKYLVAIKGKD
jgi:hypothetical protein